MRFPRPFHPRWWLHDRSSLPGRPPGRRRWGAVAAASAVAGLGLATTAVTASLAGAATTATGGKGASLPYVEMQAENAATNVTVIAPSYTQGQLADEASGRKTVTLTQG